MINEHHFSEITNILKNKGKEEKLLRIFLYLFCLVSILIKFISLIDNEQLQSNLNINHCSIYCKNNNVKNDNELKKFESNLIRCLDLCSSNNEQFISEQSLNELNGYKLTILSNFFNINVFTIIATLVLSTLFFIHSSKILINHKYKNSFEESKFDDIENERLYESIDDNEKNMTSKLI